MNYENCKFATQAVHAGQHGDPVTGAVVAPMFMTSTYEWTPEKMDRYQNGDKEGIFTYGRSRNPTQNDLQDKIACLEHGEQCLVTASGMAAISLAIMSYVRPGEHIISSKTVYGGTYALFSKIFEEMKIEVTFVDDLEPATLDKAFKDNTKIVYAEAVSNPTMEVTNIPAVVKWAHDHKILCFIDDTFTSPYLMKPLDLGVDVVVNSTTKYLNGHGDLIGGSIISNHEFVENIRSSIYQELGPVPSPFSCWLMLRGAKTLNLRMRQHCENAMAIAKWLEAQPQIEKVLYPGLESHPQHKLACELFEDRGFGGMISFVVRGGMAGGRHVVDNMKLAKYAVSLGDLDTMIQQPATMTHGKIAPEDRLKMGIPDGMVRLSVGIEDIEDIIADLAQALANV